MVKITDDGIFPAPRDKVWRLIEAHATDAQTIHPALKSIRPMNKEGNVVEQEFETNGQRTKMVTKFTPNPPESLTIEFLEGPMTGKMLNTYTEVPGGTKVVTECDMTSKSMNDKQLETNIKQFLNTGFEDDLKYLNNM